MDFTVSGGRVTNIHFAHPLGVGPQLIGDCTGAGGWEGYESWLSQLRIGINTSGGFSSQNIQIRGIDRLLVEFSGSVGTNGFASGRLQEDTPDPNIAACTHRSIFDWSAQRQ